MFHSQKVRTICTLQLQTLLQSQRMGTVFIQYLYITTSDIVTISENGNSFYSVFVHYNFRHCYNLREWEQFLFSICTLQLQTLLQSQRMGTVFIQHLYITTSDIVTISENGNSFYSVFVHYNFRHCYNLREWEQFLFSICTLQLQTLLQSQRMGTVFIQYLYITTSDIVTISENGNSFYSVFVHYNFRHCYNLREWKQFLFSFKDCLGKIVR